MLFFRRRFVCVTNCRILMWSDLHTSSAQFRERKRMKEKQSINFVIGLTIGGLLALLFWYWQKSTSAEDGALKLLDRLAETERRARQLKEQLQQGDLPTVSTAVPRFLAEAEEETPAAAPPATETAADDLTLVKGIGPVFQQRLQEHGVTTLAALRALPAETVANYCDISTARAEKIVAAAHN